MSSSSPVFKLAPGIQDYAWGKKGSTSLAAQFAKVSVPDFEIQDDKTYAELWMGTHPNLPSTLISSSERLSSHLAANSSLIGEQILNKFPDSREGNLPFLFKVLSIGTALSIQAHPSKDLARKLFKERPEIYKDPNHKPEMAIALTPFLAFLNFLPLAALLSHLQTVSELHSLIPSDLITSLSDSLTSSPSSTKPTDAQKQSLRNIFSALMNAPEDAVRTAITTLIARYDKGENVGEGEKGLVDLVKMLNGQYPGDVGVLCVFVLNVVELKVGEAAFLGADMPHAYISGDIIECMATSDNVVRAGLTPKLRDVPTLISMLTYEAGPASQQLLKPTKYTSSGKSMLYDPPIDEFSVVKVDVGKGEREGHGKVEGPSLVIGTRGSGRLKVNGEEVDVERGEVVFVGSGVDVEWVGGEDGLEAFRALVEA